MHFLVKTVLTSLFIGRVIATVKCCQSYALNVCLLVCFSWEVGGKGQGGNVFKYGCSQSDTQLFVFFWVELARE